MPENNSFSGVYPCYENQFKVGDEASPVNPVADMEEYTLTIDNGVEEWHSFGEGGWIKRLMTAKSVKLAVKGKRNVGDPGNDYIAAKAFKNGKDAEGNVLWTFPDGSTLLLPNSIISVTALGTAAATNVGPLEWEAQSNGAPTYTPAA